MKGIPKKRDFHNRYSFERDEILGENLCERANHNRKVSSKYKLFSTPNDKGTKDTTEKILTHKKDNQDRDETD